VDPSRVPDAGIRARCSVCGGVIPIGKAGAIGDDFVAPLRVTPARIAVMDQERQGTTDDKPVAAAATRPSTGGSAAVADVATRRAPVEYRPTRAEPPVAPLAAAERSAESARPAAEAAERVAAPRPAPPRAEQPQARPTPIAQRRPITPPAGIPATNRPGGPAAGVRTPPIAGFGARPAAPRPAGTPPHSASAPPRPAASSATSTAPAAPQSASAPRQAPSTSEVRRPINPFLANDPNARARRLARALVSDIVTYFPDKHREGLAHRTLPLLFKEEIKKSYEEYREQVGIDFAESTTHFQDALNEILAQGAKIF
jgi:hypothetical protein